MAGEIQNLPAGAGDAPPRTLAAWRRDASPLYQALFLAALLILGSSFVAGFVEGARWFGVPSIHGDATILGQAERALGAENWS